MNSKKAERYWQDTGCNMHKIATENIVNMHKTVLLDESITNISPVEDGVFVDATIGLGGHTKQLLEACNFNVRIIGMDVDDSALEMASQRLNNYKEQIEFVNRNFICIDKSLDELGIKEVDGIIADLGMSSFQLDHSGKGFSFNKQEPLDMRMDPSIQFTAYDLVNEMEADELEHIFKTYGEERFAKNIARTIVKKRENKPIQTSSELAAIISNSVPKKFHPKKRHPATKSFQALRIAINNELENLQIFIEKSVKLLKPGGRLVIISFHSLEDRIVKRVYKKMDSPCICPTDFPVCRCGKEPQLKIITKNPVTPGDEEINYNPRARSSKMRVGEKL